jgi:hypothetical protein
MLTLKFGFILLFVLLKFTLIESKQNKRQLNNQLNEKKNITIAFILPQDFIRFRKFQSCITNQVAKINKGNWSFSKNFYIDRLVSFNIILNFENIIYHLLYSYTYAINKNYNDIVETICTLLNTQSNTAIYINYNDYSNIEALNSRLFLKLASLINIPVMTHVPNAYSTVNYFYIKSSIHIIAKNLTLNKFNLIFFVSD